MRGACGWRVGRTALREEKRAHARLKFCTMLRSGKYRGQSYAHVIENDRKYCAWVLDAIHEQGLPRDLRKFGQHLEQEHGGLLRLGRHKGSWFNDVWKTQPDYVEWAAELTEPGDGMRKFSKFAKTKLAEEAEEEPPKKKQCEEAPRKENDEKKCVVCADRKVECAFVPCGHCVVCMRCAVLVESDGCPICRAHILMPLRIYA